MDEHSKELVELPINQLTYPLDDRQHRYPMPAGGLFSTAEDVLKFCQMILNGGTLNGRQYISSKSLHEMTTRQDRRVDGKDYGLGWSISKDGFGHGGAFKNAMEINATEGKILIFMVQQEGSWGTLAGEAIVPTLDRIASDLVAKAGASGGAAAPAKH